MEIIWTMKLVGKPTQGICWTVSRNAQMHKHEVETIEQQLRRLDKLKRYQYVFTRNDFTNATATLRRDLINEVIERCHTGEFVNAFEAIKTVANELTTLLKSNNSDYFVSRAQDISDIAEELYDTLYSVSVATIPPKAVIVTEHVSVQLALQAIEHGASAIITRRLDPLSHAALLLKGSNISCAIGDYDSSVFRDGCFISLIPDRGVIEVSSDNSIAKLGSYSTSFDEEVVLSDASKLKFSVNCCGSWESLPPQCKVGLLRTEFFPIKLNCFPSEEEFLTEYQRIRDKTSAVTIRLIDCSHEKQVPCININAERGAKTLLFNQDQLRVQLRAILIAFNKHPYRILIPYVNDITVVFKIKEIIRACVDTLRKEGVIDLKFPPIGVMLETLQSIEHVALFANHVDFAAIGTNDLIGDIVGIRSSEDEMTPYRQKILLDLISNAVHCFNSAGKQICVCGDVAANPTFTAALLSAGVRDISIPAIAWREIALEAMRW